jgi:hypothetical protein
LFGYSNVLPNDVFRFRSFTNNNIQGFFIFIFDVEVKSVLMAAEMIPNFTGEILRINLNYCV